MERDTRRPRRRDGGFSLVELLVVIVTLGVLAAIVVFAMRGVRTDAVTASCDADARNLATAIERYLSEHPSASITPADASADGVELTLVDAGTLHAVSAYHDVSPDGSIHPVTGQCVAG